MSGEVKTRRRKRPIVRGIVIGVVVLAVVLTTMRFSYPLWPSSEQASCTVTSPSKHHGGYRSRDLFPRIGTDCGSFAAEKEVTCTADPSRTVLLGPGTTYDLTVAGLRIPVVADPTVLSAQVSAVQERIPDTWFDADLDADLDDDLGADPKYDDLRSLREQFSPETLRAFDYEQPPFDPRCDPYRMLMTAEGVQMVHPARADDLLAVPEGTTASDPKLPCDDWYHCEEH